MWYPLVQKFNRCLQLNNLAGRISRFRVSLLSAGFARRTRIVFSLISLWRIPLFKKSPGISDCLCVSRFIHRHFSTHPTSIITNITCLCSSNYALRLFYDRSSSIASLRYCVANIYISLDIVHSLLPPYMIAPASTFSWWEIWIFNRTRPDTTA